ncbi:MAG TPA: hypothetical protein VFH45_01040 [Acidimicrobiales bacterium]|nr:hypothetical protein [Acidimicrobiales bacterium]
MSEEEKSPVEQALDLLVYAPFGLFITVTEELPNLVEKGRQRMTMARMMGQMAAPQLQSEAEKMIKGLVERFSPPPPARPADVAPTTAATVAPPAPPPAPSTPTAEPAAAAPAVEADGDHRTAAAHEPVDRPAPSGTGAAGGQGAAHLAIPGYDALSAMQVVQRLNGLDPDELEAVRAYESSHRGRKTILSRADQLLSGSGG